MKLRKTDGITEFRFIFHLELLTILIYNYMDSERDDKECCVRTAEKTKLRLMSNR